MIFRKYSVNQAELRFNIYTPFLSWNSKDSPDWWKAYNHIKHDRFQNKKEATLNVTINALSALFILNVIHLETMPVLVDYDIIKSNLAKGMKNIDKMNMSIFITP